MRVLPKGLTQHVGEMSPDIATTPACQIHRSEGAARRAPLENGRRDLARHHGRSGVPVATLHAEVGARHGWLIGERVLGILWRLRVPHRWDPARRLFTVPIDRVDDVLSYAQHAERRLVTVEAVDR